MITIKNWKIKKWRNYWKENKLKGKKKHRRIRERNNQAKKSG